MLSVAFLKAGYEAAAAVAKLQVPQLLGGNPVVGSGSPIIHLGTGWLIGPGLLLTNHHVINARRKGEAPASADDFERQGKAAVVRFGFDEEGLEGSPAPVMAIVAADGALDYALLRINSGARPALTFSLDLPIAPPGHGAAALNIIQHPKGTPKKVAIRNNLMAGSSDVDIRYFTDTDGGSSGSPVLDDEWRVIGLHRGTSLAPGVKFQGKDAVYINVGTRISAILDHLRRNDIKVSSA